MDLTKVFGEWAQGQPIHAEQESKGGARPYILEVEAYTPDRVALRSVNGSLPLNIIFESTPQGNVAAYAFIIDSGSEVTPTDLEGRDLPGSVLVSPPAPSTLLIHGEMVLSSSTLFAKFNGQAKLVRSFANAAESSLSISKSSGEAVVNYTFIGLERK